jgi:small-conductance mechanosensitive channel
MATVPSSSETAAEPGFRIFGKARITFLLILLALLALCLTFSWTSRDAMAHLPFLAGEGKARAHDDNQKTIVDLRPWQTAQALAPLAVSAEENEFARDAERLADHEVDQAFAAALRQATLQTQHRTLTGEALALSQKVAELQQLVKEDQALVNSLTHAASPAPAAGKGDSEPPSDDDLEIAKAQLGLDSDQLDDAQDDLDRASGDTRGQIQEELAAHEASMKKYDSEVHSGGQIAVLSAAQHGTLAGRAKAWFNQRGRYTLIQQATVEAQADIADLTAGHNALEAQANAGAAASTGNPQDRAAKLASIKERAGVRQILSIADDRIQTEQQLVAVYSKWSAQVLLQHRIVVHLMLQSLAWIALILIAMVLCDALVRRLTEHPSLDRRRLQTLRTILRLGVQVLGVLLILFVVLGTPRQISTVLGLATAGLTIALQDFILAFFGWFVLMGKNGIRVGDWVEINGVGGEVVEIGLISTTLLETGTATGTGHPTGRRITFMNNFAIRGQYFNFSTTGQWMWDEIKVTVPASGDVQAMAERIDQVVTKETEEDSRVAEQEWKAGTRENGLSRFSATPIVNLRPSGSGIDLQVRYVARASERFAVRNRLYQLLIDLIHGQEPPPKADSTQGIAEA